MSEENEPSFWKKIQLLVKIAYETYRLFISILALLFTAGLAVSGVGAYLIKNFYLVTFGFILVFATVIVFVGILSTENRKPHFDVKVEKKLVTYKYFPDRKTMEHTKFFYLESLVNDLKTFRDRYKWTCNRSGRCIVSLLSSHQKLYEKRDADWCLNEVEFDPPIPRGHKATIALKWDLYCEGEAEPFLSQIVDHKTDYLELSVFLPYKPTEIKFIHFNSGDGIESDPSTIVEKNNGFYNMVTGEIRYAVQKPKYKHKYKIGWVEPLN